MVLTVGVRMIIWRGISKSLFPSGRSWYLAHSKGNQGPTGLNRSLRSSVVPGHIGAMHLSLPIFVYEEVRTKFLNANAVTESTYKSGTF